MEGERRTEAVDRAPAWGAALAGVTGAAVALAVTQLVHAVLQRRTASVVGAVASRLVVAWAGSLRHIAVQLFGTHDKAALVTGIVVVSLAFGAALGVAARWRPWVAAAGFALFGAFGVWAAAADPLGSPAEALLACGLGVLAGVATLFGLLRLAAPRAGAGAAPGRRAFLASSVALLLGAVFVATRVRGRRAVAIVDGLPEASTAVTLPPTTLDVPGLTPYLTPADRFYRIDVAIDVPQVDPKAWQLRVFGMVDREVTLTYQDLLDEELVEEPVTMACVSNDVGGNLVGNALWRGYPLPALLARAGVQPGATQIVGRSVDGFTVGIPTEVALDGRVALVAVGMNGKPLPVEHGFPARLVIAGLYGYVSATKWLSEIELTTREAFDAFWIERGWAKDGPIQIESRIDVPGSGASVPAGTLTVAGVSWAPPVGIGKVEVQLDRGDWVEARLGAAASGNTWVQWVAELPGVGPGGHLLAARATDRLGNVQTDQTRPPEPQGATGYPYRGFTVV